MTNASVDAIAIVRTMKNIATALQLAEQLLRSLENVARPWPTPEPGLPLPRLLRLLWRVPDSCFNWVVLLKCEMIQLFSLLGWVHSGADPTIQFNAHEKWMALLLAARRKQILGCIDIPVKIHGKYGCCVGGETSGCKLSCSEDVAALLQSTAEGLQYTIDT